MSQITIAFSVVKIPCSYWIRLQSLCAGMTWVVLVDGGDHYTKIFIAIFHIFIVDSSLRSYDNSSNNNV